MTDINFVTENIRVLREIKGFSQEYVASKLEMTQSGYAKIEAGKSNVTMQKLVEIAEVLEVDVKDLLANNQKHFYSFQHNQVVNATHSIENLHMENKEIYEKMIAKLQEDMELLRDLYNKMISKQEEEIVFLRSLVEKK